MNKVMKRLSAASLTVLMSVQLVSAEGGLPKRMVWSAYDLGSSGHAEATAMAKILQDAEGIRVRVVPSGTSIGRMLPMATGKMSYGFLGNEAFFSSEATEEFAAKSWGPQDVRVLMGRPAAHAFASTNCEARPIKHVKDLKGLRVGYVEGSPSVNIKNDAMLAFGDLTRDDVEVVWFGSWSQQITALLANQIDAVSQVPLSGTSRQIAASPGGICWAEMPGDDAAGWERVKNILDFLAPMTATVGAGVSEENPIQVAGYRYPVLTTYATTPEDEVYAFMKTIHDNFDAFRLASVSAADWAIDVAGLPPYDAPAHPGAIRFLKEKGVWTAGHDAWNDARLARMEKVQNAWDLADEQYDTWRAAEREKGNNIDADAAWPEFWAKFRAENLD